MLGRPYIIRKSQAASVILLLVLLFSYNIEQEKRLAQETTVLVESYTVGGF